MGGHFAGVAHRLLWPSELWGQEGFQKPAHFALFEAFFFYPRQNLRQGASQGRKPCDKGWRDIFDNCSCEVALGFLTPLLVHCWQNQLSLCLLFLTRYVIVSVWHTQCSCREEFLNSPHCITFCTLHLTTQRSLFLLLYIIVMVRAPNNPLASFKIRETQMLRTSNCIAILLFFLKRPMTADFSHCGATEQIRTKWGNQANPDRVPGKSNKQRPQRHSRGILISSEVEQSPTSLHDKSHTELFRHALCVRAFRLACQPTAASSPPPFGLVGVNEQQAFSNCLCLTRLTECQRKKQMRKEASGT